MAHNPEHENHNPKHKNEHEKNKPKCDNFLVLPSVLFLAILVLFLVRPDCAHGTQSGAREPQSEAQK